MAAAFDLQFIEDTHTYILNSRRVPSVTQILDFIQVLDGIPLAALEDARIFGHHVHVGCDLLNRGMLDWDGLDAVLASYIRGYQTFLVDTSFVVINSEERVASISHGYAGTLDLRGILPAKRPKRCTIDIKSTFALPRTVGPQTAAYTHAYHEMTGEKWDHRYCLHLKPDGYQLVPLKDGRGIQDMTAFVSCMNVWRWRNEV